MIAAFAWFFAPPAYEIVVGGASGLVALVSLGGVLTEMTDTSACVYSKLKRQGVECDACHHINFIRPWSL